MPQRKGTVRLWGTSRYRNHPDDENTGTRGAPTGANLVDPDDPAWGHISRAAMQLVDFGFDPNDPDMAQRAIDAGRRAYEADPAVREMRSIERAAARKADPFTIMDGEVVYYMRIGNRVKIGWSTNLPYRLAAINPEELMVTEPGNRILERARHDQFSELRTHGEWFRLESPLAAHILDLQARAQQEAS